MIEPNLPTPPNDDYAKRLNLKLIELFRGIRSSISLLQGGYIGGSTNQRTTAPTTGTWAIGDQVKNSAPSESGGAGNKYVIIGWICTTSGIPGTWKEMRTLTGN